MRYIYTIVLFLICLMLPLSSNAQQLGDLSGRTLILNDGGTAGGTKNTITLKAADAATLTSNYTLVWPIVAGTVGQLMRVGSVAGITLQLDWSPALVSSPYEEATVGQFNIRRITSLIVGPPAIPGNGANDLQSTRTLAAQTASGANSIIGGGQQNTAGALNSGILGGLLNSLDATSDNSAIVSGESNAIIGAQLSFIGGGETNSISGRRSAILGGQSNVVSGNTSAVWGGNNLTISASTTGGFNSGVAMSISTANVVVMANNDVWLANTNNTASQLRFYEPQSTTGAFPTGTTKFAAFRAAAAMGLDNIYDLPAANGTVGQVLKIATVTGNDATLAWNNDGGNPTVQNEDVLADNTVIAVNATTTFLVLTSNGANNNRTITFTDGTIVGQLVVIKVVAGGAQGVELVDGGTFSMAGDFGPDNNDTITLIWDGVDWVEVARRNN